MRNTTEIKFEIEHSAYKKIRKALEKYGSYEIGGVLIGYKKGRNHFSIADVTIADDIGRFHVYNFIREPVKSQRVIIRSFRKKRHYYIGEWHSHPRFRLYPSSGDIATMQGILTDRRYGVNFALLIITKLKNPKKHKKIEMAGFLFHKRLSNFLNATIVDVLRSK